MYLINIYNPDVIVGTETWLNSSIKDNEIIPADFNYKIYRKDRSDGYGGVLLAISDHIASFPIPELQNDAEMVWAKVCIIGWSIHQLDLIIY